MQDFSTLAGGVYCLIYNGSTVDTYYYTDSEFSSAYVVSAMTSSNKVTDDADNDEGFEIFKCTVSANVMTCDHF